MSLEEEYLEYVAIFTLSMITVSASYFVDPSRPLTFAILLLIPFTFGYITYVSREGFRKSSLTSLITLFFVMMNPITSITALVIGLGSPLVSGFSGGERFKDYFRTASIPLLILGLVVGSAAYYQASNNMETQEQIKDLAANTVSIQAETIVEETSLIENQKNAQVQLVEEISRSSIRASQARVLNSTQDDLEPEQQLEVQEAFQDAEEEVPDRIVENAEHSMNGSTLDVSDRLSSAVRENLNGKMFIALIPLTAMVLYGANPLVGILMALSAKFFSFLNRKIDEPGAT